jgi:hypothetical protein
VVHCAGYFVKEKPAIYLLYRSKNCRTEAYIVDGNGEFLAEYHYISTAAALGRERGGSRA